MMRTARNQHTTASTRQSPPLQSHNSIYLDANHHDRLLLARNQQRTYTNTLTLPVQSLRTAHNRQSPPMRRPYQSKATNTETSTADPTPSNPCSRFIIDNGGREPGRTTDVPPMGFEPPKCSLASRYATFVAARGSNCPAHRQTTLQREL